MPEPTKADLKAAVTRLTEENAALYDIFAAARAAADNGTDYPWIIGYIGYIGNTGQPGDRGNVGILRSLAAGVRRGPRGARPAPGEGGVLFPAACDPDEADEVGPCMLVGCGHDLDDHSLDLENGDRLYCQRCGCRRFLSAEAMRASEPAPRGLASCGHPADEDGECGCSSWPERAPELFIDGSPFCTARRGIPGQGGDLCELPLHHDGDHRAPGDDEGDPDVTWSDEAAAVLS